MFRARRGRRLHGRLYSSSARTESGAAAVITWGERPPPPANPWPRRTRGAGHPALRPRCPARLVRRGRHLLSRLPATPARADIGAAACNSWGEWAPPTAAPCLGTRAWSGSSRSSAARPCASRTTRAASTRPACCDARARREWRCGPQFVGRVGAAACGPLASARERRGLSRSAAARQRASRTTRAASTWPAFRRARARRQRRGGCHLVGREAAAGGCPLASARARRGASRSAAARLCPSRSTRAASTRPPSFRARALRERRGGLQLAGREAAAGCPSASVCAVQVISLGGRAAVRSAHVVGVSHGRISAAPGRAESGSRHSDSGASGRRRRLPSCPGARAVRGVQLPRGTARRARRGRRLCDLHSAAVAHAKSGVAACNS
jgi:hypothetical protein